MSKRPDLDSLMVPKGGDAPAPLQMPVSEGAAKGYAHTLSLRLTADQYRRLRRFVADQEEKTSKRLTHQSIIEAALEAHLDRLGG